MTNLQRLTGKIFGETATATGDDPQIGQFGSALAGTYVGTTDVATIQNLPAWSNGFIDSVTPNEQFPPLPEMTGFGKVLSYQTAYTLQKGVPEWDAGTTYYTGDFCKGVGEGKLYVSKIDSNINNDLTDANSWEEFSSISDDRLHALKSYLDEGELLTDPEGLADVKSYALSNFDISKFTIAGSPTITDGVASGFSTTNTITANITFDISTADSWEINGEFTTGNSLTDAQYIFTFGDSDTFYGSGVAVGGGNGCRCYIADNANTIMSTTDGQYTVATNTRYSYKVTYDSTTGYNFYCGLYGSGLSLVASTASTTKLNYGTTVLRIGRYTSFDWRPFGGSIDLKQISLKVDGTEVFYGNKTGVDTYIINSTTVTIPYTLSKTGSKIVDSAYRTQVASVYNEFGYAPYYTLSDTDFTLPQGELYGMMLNQSTPHIVETYVNGSAWYRVYSNGWCEQGGDVTYTASISAGQHAGTSVTFMKEFKDTSYSFVVTGNRTNCFVYEVSDEGTELRTTTGTSAGFRNVNAQSASTGTKRACWVARGYLK